MFGYWQAAEGEKVENAYLPLYSCAYMLGTCLLHTFVINNERDEYHQMKKMVTDLKKEILDINDTWSKKY